MLRLILGNRWLTLAWAIAICFSAARLAAPAAKFSAAMETPPAP